MSSQEYVRLDEELANDSDRLLNSELQQRNNLDLSFNNDSEDGYFYKPDLKHSTISTPTDYSYRKKGFNWICLAFSAILGLAGFLWLVSIVRLFSGFSGSEGLEDDTLQTLEKRIQFEDIFNSSFTPKRTNLVWVENDPRDGIYTYRDTVSNDILLESIEDRKSQVFVKEADLTVGDGVINVHSFELSHDSEYILFRTNVTSQWRHSATFNAYIYRVSDKKIMPLNKLSAVGKKPLISYAKWSPTGHHLAYVMKNDLYITDLSIHQRVTFDGSKTVFNGIPDWVYEEEVLESNHALWWSPDSTHIAFLKLDETKVPEYHLQMFTDRESTYPRQINIRYPKAGTPNPIVSLHVYSLKSKAVITANGVDNASNSSFVGIQQSSDYKDFDPEDRLIVDVAWATNSHTHLLFKQMNRIQDEQLTNVIKVDDNNLLNSTVELVRVYKPTDGGWIDVSQSMVYLPSKDSKSPRYLDILDSPSGYAHIAIVTLNSSEKSKVSWLTSGDWEVVAGTVKVDAERQLIHFVSTERSTHERHLYRISFADENPASTKTCITCPEDPEEHAYYSTSFSPKSGYYILNYMGPGIPTTIVKKVDDPEFRAVLQDNNGLRSLLKEYNLPRSRMTTFNNGGIEMTAMEVVPFDFDPKKKYPVLFHVYGGPSSQLVSYKFELNWQTFVASQLGFIVVTVDGRGTGFQGRKYRVGVRERLGELETIDQVNAGRYWASLDYVDEYRMAIWGWSYGGYMTTKVIEADAGIFSTGLAVAPVTDWRFYDSVYTERYMKTPKLNPTGYVNSAVNNMTGFNDANYLLIHGTGDDNVHFQHTAVLIDKLTLADIHNYRVQIFSDSNHAIVHHNANKNVYYLLTEYLLESFGGHEYKHIYNEMNGKFSGPIPHND